MKELFAPVVCSLAHLQGVLVYFHRLVGIKYLDKYLCNLLLQRVFCFGYGKPCYLLAGLLLFDSIQPFVTIPQCPLRIQTIVPIISGFTVTTDDFRSAYRITGFLIRTVRHILPCAERQTGEEGGFGCFHIYRTLFQ